MRKQLPYNHTFLYADRKVSYRVMGKGKPIVLIHGSLTHDGWGKFDDELSQYFKLYIIDLPGFGSSDSIKGKLHNTDLYADVLGSFLKQLKLQNAPLIALSWGTVIAVKAAQRGWAKGHLILAATPGKIEGIIFEITNAIPIPIKRFLISTTFGKKVMLVPVIRQNIVDSSSTTDDEILKMIESTDIPAIVDTDYKREISYELPLLVAKIKNKITYLYGEKDPMKKQTKNFVNDYIVIPTAGHNIFYTAPKQTLQAIKKILK